MFNRTSSDFEQIARGRDARVAEHVANHEQIAGRSKNLRSESFLSELPARWQGSDQLCANMASSRFAEKTTGRDAPKARSRPPG